MPSQDSSYFVMISIPLMIVLAAMAAAVFYFAGGRSDLPARLNIGVAIGFALGWIVICTLLTFKAPRSQFDHEISIAISASTLALTVFGLTVLGFKLRPPLSFCVALFCGSLWFLIVWFARTAK